MTPTSAAILDELEKWFKPVHATHFERCSHWNNQAYECDCPSSLIPALRKAMEGEREPCIWREDSSGDYWSGSCGADWCLEADGPEENGMKYCPKCGHPVKVEKLTIDEGETP